VFISSEVKFKELKGGNMKTLKGLKFGERRSIRLIGLMVLVLTFALVSTTSITAVEKNDPAWQGSGNWITTSNGSGQPAPLMIVPRPPKDSDLNVSIRTDKKQYLVGENARIFFELNKAAYVYILDYTPNSGVKLIYPNKWEGNNKRSSGTHVLPSGNYNFGVTGPSGNEYLQALATTKKIDIYEFVRYPNNPFRNSGFPDVPDPEALKKEIQSGLKAKFGLHLGGDDSNISFQLTPVEWDTDFYDFQVVSSQPSNQPPQARFSYSPVNPPTGARVRFDGSSSYDPDGQIRRIEWDLDGDGNIEAAGKTVYTRYRNSGRVRVTLRVTDNEGDSSSTTQYIQVGQSNKQPKAEFSYSPSSPSVGDTVRFDASSSYDPDGSVTSWNWDLDGDGRTDRSGRVVWNSFNSPGTRQVSLTVRDNEGATAQTSKRVDVGPTRPRFNQINADRFNSSGNRKNGWDWSSSFGDYSRWTWYSVPNSPTRAYLNFDLLVANQDWGSGYGATLEFRIMDMNGNLIEQGSVDLANTFRPQYSGDTGGVGYEASGSYHVSNPGELRNGFRVRIEWPPRNNRYYFGARQSAVRLAYEY
jgi:PKD repeat protein